jgi:hypothetical protein
MRFRAPRVALVLTAMSAGFLLAGCAAIDDLRTAISQWFESATFPDGREESLRDVPTANPITPPEAKQEVANAPRKVAKPARKLPRPQNVRLQTKPSTTDPGRTERSEVIEWQSAPPATLRLRTQYPEAPPPGVFSR